MTQTVDNSKVKCFFLPFIHFSPDDKLGNILHYVALCIVFITHDIFRKPNEIINRGITFIFQDNFLSEYFSINLRKFVVKTVFQI